MIPRTDFHCKTITVVNTFFWMKFSSIFAYFLIPCLLGGALIQYKYLIRLYFGCNTKLCLIVPNKQRKYIFTLESFFAQGILNDSND